ncbi:VOC family protein [Nocardioides sp. LHG3406-4]|uniref:VOC family protein n=1 Tax=Nocardioides sp. LHG3406-4 TaxID=2804575 RepID=UPI003CF4D155
MGDLEPIARTYPAGVTCWVECEQPDPAAAEGFYGGLFGWQFEDVLPVDAPGRYVLATLDGLDVAALSGPASWVAAWSTYVAVDDVDSTVASMAELGASVVSEPEDVGEAGRAATLTDPQGAQISLWLARRRLGAQLTNAPGTWNFSDLHTTDPGAAGEFYARTLGWRVVDQGWGTAIQVPGYGAHLESTTDAGILARQASAPEGFEDVIGAIAGLRHDERPHWHVTFAVADRDASAAVAERLGGTVVSTSEDDWTRAALVRDPQGAELTLSQFAPQEWS